MPFHPFKLQAIPAPGARIYSSLVIKSPLLRGLYTDAASEICAKVPSGKVLDVGTGPGYLPFEIAKKSDGLQVVGIDLSPEMIRIAERNAATLGLSGRVIFAVANASKLPFPDNTFDLVVSTLSFHHWLEPVKCLKEICRVLKQGGEAWIYDLRRDVSKGAALELRNRYGIFVSFACMHLVRWHSSITLKYAEEAISSSETGFLQKEVEQRGVFLKFKLLK